MGKPTGFLDYDRKTSAAEAPKERIKHFNEFHEHLPMEEQQKQGARCMECGVPFCQAGVTIAGMTSGCPLHNLVPEWNDLVYAGNWERAYNRLKKTNNFPEFTARVCPALCENACTCGLNGDAVATKENEYAIIENAYRTGLRSIMCFSSFMLGIPYIRSPPSLSLRSNTVTLCPLLLSWSATARPAGPLPTTATVLFVRTLGGFAAASPVL